jgi:hypothetical protein
MTVEPRIEAKVLILNERDRGGIDWEGNYETRSGTYSRTVMSLRTRTYKQSLDALTCGEIAHS